MLKEAQEIFLSICAFEKGAFLPLQLAFTNVILGLWAIVPNTDPRNPKTLKNWIPEVILCRNGHFVASCIPLFQKRGSPTNLFLDAAKTEVQISAMGDGETDSDMFLELPVKDWKCDEDAGCVLTGKPCGTLANCFDRKATESKGDADET
ncbi:hypothetical protein KFL_000520080 [Klebsormidium nitens]|uniref:Uncharacterized protein n=1 Tax=Klebsormidium nitens TaxID=105231 RepID=A0A1Y1HWW4_KLENI|nr:hypothetical protein KFL_000520080 [Klebsormidium nitens]|eukprot:GAQ80338.1 hypothetical protein KFL_000520080 [Klebsormidium nitens]